MDQTQSVPQQAFGQFQTQQQANQDPQAVQSAVDLLKQKSKQIITDQQQEKSSQFIDPETASLQQAAISRALGQLLPASNTPQAQIGRAINTPAYAGYCLQFVDDKTGNTKRQPTAYADYLANAKSGNISPSSSSIPSGSRVYFAPDQTNGNNGHIGLMNKNGTFTAATDNGIQSFTIPQWEKYTGQKFIGYAKSSK